MLMFAVLARERARLFRLLLLPFLFCYLTAHGSAASAASLNVKVKQLNPTSEAQQVTCVLDAKCLLPIDIQTGSTKETLTVEASFMAGGVQFKFQTPKGYLYAGLTPQADPQYPLYETIWHTAAGEAGTPSTTDITLFLPVVAFPVIAQATTSVEQSVAEIEITTEQQP